MEQGRRAMRSFHDTYTQVREGAHAIKVSMKSSHTEVVSLYTLPGRARAMVFTCDEKDPRGLSSRRTHRANQSRLRTQPLRPFTIGYNGSQF